MLSLPDVTLLCVDTRTPQLALESMLRSCAEIQFGDAVLFTEPSQLPPASGAPWLRIEPVQVASAAQYSQFMLSGILPRIRTSHVLVVQWDGWVLNATAWNPGFLDWDFIGAPVYFERGRPAVGNGGFSLRSRRLMEVFLAGAFTPRHPEDVCLCCEHRARLEHDHAIRFAPLDVAARFSFERIAPAGATFGFHGLFNFPLVLAPDELDGWLSRMPDEMARGLDAHDLAASLIEAGRLESASRLVAMRNRLGMADRRTLRLNWRLMAARWRPRP